MNRLIKERNKVGKRVPANYTFWQFVIAKPDELEQFYLRGNSSQKDSIKRVLNYMRRFERDKFKEANGKYWLEKFRNTEGDKCD